MGDFYIATFRNCSLRLRWDPSYHQINTQNTHNQSAMCTYGKGLQITRTDLRTKRHVTEASPHHFAPVSEGTVLRWRRTFFRVASCSNCSVLVSLWMDISSSLSKSQRLRRSHIWHIRSTISVAIAAIFTRNTYIACFCVSAHPQPRIR